MKGDQDQIEGDQNVVEGDQDLVKDRNEQDLVEDLDYDIKDLVEHLVKGDQDTGDEMEESGEVGETTNIKVIIGNLGSMALVDLQTYNSCRFSVDLAT